MQQVCSKKKILKNADISTFLKNHQPKVLFLKNISCKDVLCQISCLYDQNNRSYIGEVILPPPSFNEVKKAPSE